LTVAEVKFMRKTAGYTGLGYEKNSDIMKELSTQTVVKFLGN